MEVNSQAIAEVEFVLTVTRCGCDAPLSHIDAVCPTPREAPTVVARAATSEE